MLEKYYKSRVKEILLTVTCHIKLPVPDGVNIKTHTLQSEELFNLKVYFHTGKSQVFFPNDIFYT